VTSGGRRALTLLTSATSSPTTTPSRARAARAEARASLPAADPDHRLRPRAASLRGAPAGLVRQVTFGLQAQAEVDDRLRHRLARRCRCSPPEDVGQFYTGRCAPPDRG
jgi:hypothetical protein